MSETTLLPEVRINGFKEAWKAYELNDLCSLITKQTGFDYSATIKPSLLRVGNEDTYPFIQNKDFLGTKINLNTDFYIPKKIAETFPNILLDRPSILISISGKIGNAGLYTLPQKAFIGGAVGICKLTDEANGLVTLYNLLGGAGQRYFQTLIKASSHSNITVEDIRKIKIYLPSSNEEKNRIGTYFSFIDELISLNKAKLEKLSNLKKAMLEKMFPKQGADVPEIRFKGFAGAWEEKELGVITNTTIGEFVIKTRQNPNSPYPVFNGGKSYTGFYDEYNNEGNKVIISARGANAGYVNFAKNRFWAGNSCYSVEILDKDQFSIEFFYHYIKYNQNRFIENQQAANIPSVSKSDVEKFVISHPQFKEQVEIADYFQNIDKLISLQETKLEKLGNLKKACLEKMFV